MTQNFHDEELRLGDVAGALTTVCSETELIIFTPQGKEHSPEKCMETENIELKTLDDFFSTFSTKEELCLKMEYFPSHLTQIAAKTRGQSTNPLWYAVRQHVITASKAHDIKTRMVTFKNKA